jgi:GR25 family glycosyltransferase involved in LPS biosynthesis
MNVKLEQEYKDQTGRFVLHRDDDGAVRHTRKYVEWLEKRVKKQKKVKKKSYLKGYTDGLELGCTLSHSKELRNTRLPKDY